MATSRILYILPQPYLLSRGSSFRAMATLNALSDLGYQIDLLCYPIGLTPEAHGYHVYRSLRPFLPGSVKIGPSLKKVFFDIPLCFKARRLLHKNHYDVIHGVEEAGFIAGWLGRKHNVPYVFDMHSWMSQQIADGNHLKFRWAINLFRKLELSSMHAAGAIVTVGPQMTEILKTVVPEVYKATLPDCPLTFNDMISTEMKESIASRYFAPGRKTILYTGNFHTYQGIDLLLESIKEFKLLVSDRFDFSLLLVGGSAGEAKIVKRYKKMVKNLGIEKEVIFCGEHPAETMPVFMENSDLLVSSRRSGNNVPLKIYTYLASGKLLVATDIQSHTQVLNENNCLLTRPEAKAMAQTLYRGLVEISEQKRQAISAAAKKTGGDEQFQKFKTVLKDCYDFLLNQQYKNLTEASNTEKIWEISNGREAI